MDEKMRMEDKTRMRKCGWRIKRGRENADGGQNADDKMRKF